MYNTKNLTTWITLRSIPLSSAQLKIYLYYQMEMNVSKIL